MARKSSEQMAAAAAETANKLAELTQDKPAKEAEPAAVEKTDDEPRARVETRNEPRRQAMDEILAKRGQLDEQKAEVETEKPKKEEPAPELKEEPAPVADPVPETPAVKMAKVKVDGEEFEVPQEDVDAAGGVAAYQKDRAADNRLRKTNETLAETRRVQAQISEWISQNTPKPVVPTDDEFIASRMDLIRYGSSEESAKAMQEVLAKSNRQIDPGVITQMAVNQVNEDMAVRGFAKEFADIVQNPMLLEFSSMLEKKKKSTLKMIPDWPEFYRAIGNEVRSMIGRPNQPAKVQAPGDTPSQPDKEARKASIVNLPSAAARAALPEAEKPETRADILNEMRKRRGIPTG